MFSARRGQAANQAGVLVILIAVVIVLYMLLLPPHTRGDLLGENVTVDSPSHDRDVLLSYVPSNDPSAGLETKPLPVFTLRTDVAGNSLAERSGVSLRRSVFHSDTEVIRFSAPHNTQNVLLSFSVVEAKGSLEVVLNGQVVYSGAINRRQPEPIELPASLLESQNSLELRLSGVGFSFWSTNRYELRNVRVTADVVSFERASQTQRFVVQDAGDVRAAVLDFVPDCFEQAGRMEIVHNENLVYSGFPTCGIPLTIELAPGQMREGENLLIFSVQSGEYIIDQAELALYREPRDSNGEFMITSQQLDMLAENSHDIMLSLSFSQPGARGTVVLNGQPLDFRTQKQSFANAITSYVRSGTNTVRIQSSDVPVTLVEVYEG